MLVQGRYRIVRHLREGGMGSVYEAVDTRLGNRVALKRASIREDEAREAFRLEARILGALRHPALPVVIDYFSESGEDYLVMDFVDGEDFGEMIARENRPSAIADVVRWGDRILDALSYLHENGVVHRDIKPANLKLTRTRDVVLLDFGISKGSMDWQGTDRSILSGGTSGYSPFEQLADLGTDERSDLYALGVTLYQLATGVLPADARARVKAIVAGKTDPMMPADQLNGEVPRALAVALERATALEREDRPASARELRQLLSATAADLPTLPSAPRSRRIVVEIEPATRRHELSHAPLAGEKVSPQVRRGRGRPPERLPSLTLTGHGRVLSAIAAPDGRTFFSAGEDGAIRVWDIGGREIERLSGHDGPIHALAISADGILLMSGGADATVRVWEVASGRSLATLEAHEHPVRSVAVSTDGVSLVSGDAGGGVVVWDVAAGRGLYRIEEPGGVWTVSVSADGSRALAGGEGRSILVWELTSGREVARLEGHRQLVYSAVFSPDGTHVLSGGGDTTARIFTIERGEEVAHFDAHRSAVRSAVYSPDGRLVLSGSIGGVVRVWSVSHQTERLRLESRMGLIAVGTLPPDHEYLFAVASDGSVPFWSLGRE